MSPVPLGHLSPPLIPPPLSALRVADVGGGEGGQLQPSHSVPRSVSDQSFFFAFFLRPKWFGTY